MSFVEGLVTDKELIGVKKAPQPTLYFCEI